MLGEQAGRKDRGGQSARERRQSKEPDGKQQRQERFQEPVRRVEVDRQGDLSATHQTARGPEGGPGR